MSAPEQASRTAGESGERFDAVVDVLRTMLPEAFGGIPPTPDTPIDVGHPFRAGLHAMLASRRPDAPSDLLTELRTWGDVDEWFGEALLDASNQQPGPVFTTLVRLRPMVPPDVPALYATALDPAVAMAWRYRGHTMSYADFERTLFEGVLAQYIVETLSGEMQGLATLYSADMSNGHAWLALLRADGGRRVPGAMILGAAQMLRQGFSAWPFHKIYVELPVYNSWLIDALVESGLAEEEGRLTNHYFHDGRWLDKIIAAFYREAFLGRFSEWFPGETSSSELGPPDRFPT